MNIHKNRSGNYQGFTLSLIPKITGLDSIDPIASTLAHPTSVSKITEQCQKHRLLTIATNINNKESAISQNVGANKSNTERSKHRESPLQNEARKSLERKMISRDWLNFEQKRCRKKNLVKFGCH